MAHIARTAAGLFIAISATTALAQTSPPTPSTSKLDVIVRDASGNPIHGLTAQNFTLTLNGQPQPIKQLEEHPTAAPPAKALDLPPGTFSDYTPLSASGSLNVLVLDSLNIPAEAQLQLRAQLQQFAQHAPPAGQLAIFGLTSHLILLQDFTTSPGILKEAVEHKLIPRGEALADATSGPNRDAIARHDLELAQIAANLHQFEAAMNSTDRQFRQQYTLDALHTLARYLAGLPGRKNVLWLAADFPVTLATQPAANDELHQTIALLSQAQASLYPIDARSILAHTADAPKLKYEQPQAAESAAMTALATITGGTPILNVSALNDAVTQATQQAANYYSLAFTPNTIAPLQSVHITLSSPNAASAQLLYPASFSTPLPPSPAAADDSHAHAAMARGAPTPLDILFKVRVLPAASAPEPNVTPGNQQNPSYKVPGPWQRYDIDFIAPSSEFLFTTDANGQRTSKFEAFAYVYDGEGRLLNLEAKTVTVSPKPEDLDRLLQTTFSLHLQVSVPVPQQTYLRLALHDLQTDRFGVVEIPVSSVSHLAPTSPQSTPAGTPATH